MFDQLFTWVDTKVLSVLALLPNITQEEQYTASFEIEHRSQGVFLRH
jgi:hypothetical protein